ncbi:MAG: hypothetical protein WD871_01805 [Xanthobacteraceae bacterium]
MTPNQEREYLRLRGTKVGGLKPANVVQAAARDLDLRAKKLSAAAPATEPYAFHRVHVRKAKTVRELVALALAERDRGLGSAKFHTRLIYEGIEVLRAALASFSGGGELESPRPVDDVLKGD